MEKYLPTHLEDYYRTILNLCKKEDHSGFVLYHYKDYVICEHNSGWTISNRSGIQEVHFENREVLTADYPTGFTAEYIINYIDEHSR